MTTLSEAGLLTSKVVGVWRGLAFAIQALCGVLVGRLGAVAGASFEASGRLVGDVHADVNAVLSVLLVLRARSATLPAAAATAAGATAAADNISITWRRDFDLPLRPRVDDALAHLAAACDLPDIGSLLAARGVAVVSIGLSCYPTDALWSPACWQHVLIRGILDACPSVVLGCQNALAVAFCKLVTAVPSTTLPSALLEYDTTRCLCCFRYD